MVLVMVMVMAMVMVVLSCLVLSCLVAFGVRDWSKNTLAREAHSVCLHEIRE